MAKKRSRKQSGVNSEPPTKKRKVEPKISVQSKDKNDIKPISNKNETKSENNNNNNNFSSKQKPRKLRKEKKKDTDDQVVTSTEKPVPLRKNKKTGKKTTNVQLNKVYFNNEKESNEEPKIPLRSQPSKKKQAKRAIQQKVYFPRSNKNKEKENDDEDDEYDDYSEESGPALEGVAGDESLVMDSDLDQSYYNQEMNDENGNENEEEEDDDDDESLSEYKEDDESEDNDNDTKEVFIEDGDDEDEEEEEDESEDDDDEKEEMIEDGDEEDEEEDENEMETREANLLSNQGTRAADIGLIDIDSDIEDEEIQDEEEDDDDDEEDEEDEETGKGGSKAANETEDTIVHHGFGGEEGWSDLLQATRKVNLMPSKQPQDRTIRSNSAAQRRKEKMQLSRHFQGLIRIEELPHGFFEDELRGFFSQFGKVGNCVVARNPKTHEPLRYALIEFKTPEVAEIAADAMNGYMMLHRILRVTAEYHPGPELWLKSELNVEPVARYDIPSLLLDKAQRRRARRQHRLMREDLDQRLIKMRSGIQRKEKEMKEKYGIDYEYKMDAVVPDCSGARVTLDKK